MDLKLMILGIVQAVELGWSKVTEENFAISRLTGNSSQVYLLEAGPNVSPKNFIFRFFGSAGTLDINTSSSITLELSKHNLAPKIFLETSAYRLEEYLQGYRSLSISEIREVKIAEKISAKLKFFHSLDFSSFVNPNSIICVENAKKWRKVAQNNFSCINDNERTQEIEQAILALSQEYWNVFEEILPNSSPVVVSHMDTSYLNILYQEEKEEVYLLDFDYTGYCYRGFDLAMLLTDIKYDYNINEYPYFKVDARTNNIDSLLAACVKAYGEGVEMFIECKQCMVASHYLWAMWAFSLYSSSSERFDMLKYGILRFQDFLSSYESLKNTSLDSLKTQSALYFL